LERSRAIALGVFAAVLGMREGGRRLLVIPGDLAYGETGQPPDIGPNETLVFAVDLVEVR
jgi:peptidylprolyl isomerase